ncbi:hypothetical protein Taro_030448 [Colocasia esculenta]|uniref:ACT domain-containing protein ACR n=1 Tax=Colocasia esculenta TaxID=4460 RepID=A0A843VP72_COLES|nr:hypothetical protein [Colocasia esculenta]
MAATHADRRLHQMFLADGDCELGLSADTASPPPFVSIQRWDHPKLLFDMKFYIRHVDGSPIRLEAGRQRVIRCLQVAVQRRTSEGVRLELSTEDERGLLTGLTRALHENSLSVVRVEVSAKGGTAHGVFYVTDASGHPADARAVEAARQRVGPGSLSLVDTSGGRRRPHRR